MRLRRAAFHATTRTDTHRLGSCFCYKQQNEVDDATPTAAALVAVVKNGVGVRAAVASIRATCASNVGTRVDELVAAGAAAALLAALVPAGAAPRATSGDVLEALRALANLRPHACSAAVLPASDAFLRLVADTEKPLDMVQRVAELLRLCVFDTAERALNPERPAGEREAGRGHLADFFIALLACARRDGGATAVAEAQLLPVGVKALEGISEPLVMRPLPAEGDPPSWVARLGTVGPGDALLALLQAASKLIADPAAAVDQVAELCALLPRVVESADHAAAFVAQIRQHALLYGALMAALQRAVLQRAPTRALALAVADAVNDKAVPALYRRNVQIAPLLAQPAALAEAARLASTMTHEEGAPLADMIHKALKAAHQRPAAVLLDASFPLWEIVQCLKPLHATVLGNIVRPLREGSAFNNVIAALQQASPEQALAAAVSLTVLWTSSQDGPLIFPSILLAQWRPLFSEAVVAAFRDGNVAQPPAVCDTLRKLLEAGGAAVPPCAPKEPSPTASAGKRKASAFVNKRGDNTTEIVVVGASFHVNAAAAARHSAVLCDTLEVAANSSSRGPVPLPLLERLANAPAAFEATLEFACSGDIAAPGFPGAQGATLLEVYAAAHAMGMVKLQEWSVARVVPTLDVDAVELEKWWELAHCLPSAGDPVARACAAAWLRRCLAVTTDAAEQARVLRTVFYFDAPLQPGQERNHRAATAELAEELRTCILEAAHQAEELFRSRASTRRRAP